MYITCPRADKQRVPPSFCSSSIIAGGVFKIHKEISAQHAVLELMKGAF
jgi:hypothetical protein